MIAILSGARDICQAHRRTTADCGVGYFCGKALYGVGDLNVCMLDTWGGTKIEGEACTAGSECASHFCSSSDSICRERCSTASDCTNPIFPICNVELHIIYSSQRLVNVCLP